MDTHQYLNEFVSQRLPAGSSLEEFFDTADEDEAEKLHEQAEKITDLEANKRTSPQYANTQSYAELEQEREQTMAHMNLASSQTERERLQRKLDELQREMQSGKGESDDTQKSMSQAIEKLEDMTDKVIKRLN